MADVEQNFGSGLLGYVMLMDPTTGKPYKAQNVVQQTDGEFNTTGLATLEMQQRELDAIEAISARMADTTPVEVQNPEMPLPAGAATDAKQDSIITALGNLAGLLGGNLKVSIDGQPLQAQITSTTLPAGAATAANQADVKTALNAVLTALAGVLEVSGDVNVSSDEPLAVEGTVHVDNTTFSVTPSGTFNVTVTGGATSAKQDTLISTLQDVLGRLSNPLAVSDGGGSVTIDGNVGVSGTIPVTQSGAWNVGVTGTPNVNIANTSVPVSGTVAVSGTPNVNITNTSVPVSGSVGINGTVPVSGSVGITGTAAVTQSGTWNVNTLPQNAATLTTTPTAVSVGTTSVQLAPSNANRKSVIINNRGNTPLQLSFAATAVANVSTLDIPANGWANISRGTWTGVITGIRASGSATADAIVTVVS